MMKHFLLDARERKKHQIDLFIFFQHCKITNKKMVIAFCMGKKEVNLCNKKK